MQGRLWCKNNNEWRLDQYHGAPASQPASQASYSAAPINLEIQLSWYFKLISSLGNLGIHLKFVMSNLDKQTNFFKYPLLELGRQFRLDVVGLRVLSISAFVLFQFLHSITPSQISARLSVSISHQTEEQTSLLAKDSLLIGESVN